jgi:hypothetical protein
MVIVNTKLMSQDQELSRTTYQDLGSDQIEIDLDEMELDFEADSD